MAITFCISPKQVGEVLGFQYDVDFLSQLNLIAVTQNVTYQPVPNKALKNEKL